ncbi:MAG: PspA/IM30 family protein [Candidatus Eremiobacteraeota bacterium]|nr:PspA/IM30 family protein [Candidatus Eremiobacteraeota bacterium]
MWKRLNKIFKGFLSLFIKGIESSNPKALIEAEKEALREKVAKYNQNLAKQAGFVSRLDRLIAEGQKKEADYIAKTQANLKAGNRDIAGKYAMELKTIREQLVEYRSQLKSAKEVYENLLKTKEVTVRDAKNKIDELVRKLSQVEMKEAEAELREMSQAMIAEIGSDGDTMSRIQEHLDERIEEATGRAMVAKDSADTSEISMKESEMKALEQQALSEFAASVGIEMPGMEAPLEAPAGTKAMGPLEREETI